MTGKYHYKEDRSVWIIISKRGDSYQSEWSHVRGAGGKIHDISEFVTSVLEAGYVYDETWEVEQLIGEYEV